MQEIVLTKDEQRAIKSLERLSKKWPATLSLFGWSGTLHVFKKAPDGRRADITTIGIYCDGGDPSSEEVDCEVYIDYQ